MVDGCSSGGVLLSLLCVLLLLAMAVVAHVFAVLCGFNNGDFALLVTRN